MRILLSPLVLLAGVAALSPAVAAREDTSSVQHLAGTYAVDCHRPESARATVDTGALEVRRGRQRVRGISPRSDTRFFGPHPPKGFVTALKAKDQQRRELLFFVYRDGKGRRTIQIDGSPGMRQLLGEQVLAQRFRHCG
jgi:hypothetical protein